MFVHCSARQTRGRALGGGRAATCPHGARALVRGSVGVAGVGPRRPCGHTVTVTSAPLGRRSGKVAAGGVNGRVWLCSDKTLFTGTGGGLRLARAAGCGLRSSGRPLPCGTDGDGGEKQDVPPGGGEGRGGSRSRRGGGREGTARASQARVRHVCGACATCVRRPSSGGECHGGV